MASKFATPFATGVKAGPDYEPKFKVGGPYVYDKQPEAITPVVKAPYFTTTGHKIPRKQIKSTPFAYNKFPFGTHQPIHKASYNGLTEGVNWQNAFPQADKEVVNETHNRLAIDRKERTEMIPIQWAPPEVMNYKDKSNESMRDYFQNLADERLRQKVQQLQAKGYSQDEIVKAIQKYREADIQKAIADPTNTEKLMSAQIAQLTSVRQAITGLNYRNENGGVPQRANTPIRGSIGLDALLLAGRAPPARPAAGTRENPFYIPPPNASGQRTMINSQGIYTRDNRGRPAAAAAAASSSAASYAAAAAAATQPFSPLQTRLQRDVAGTQLPPSDIAASLFRTTPPGAGGRGRGRGRGQ